MKVLGSRVRYVRKSSFMPVTYSATQYDIQLWSCMFAVNVQSVSIQSLRWSVIIGCTQSTNSSAVFCVIKVSWIKTMLYGTLRDVVLSEDLLTNYYFSICFGLTSDRICLLPNYVLSVGSVSCTLSYIHVHQSTVIIVYHNSLNFDLNGRICCFTLEMCQAVKWSYIFRNFFLFNSFTAVTRFKSNNCFSSLVLVPFIWQYIIFMCVISCGCI